jgi:WD40 repeat protein
MGHAKLITAMLISPVSPNHHLVTAGEDGRIMVWDYVKGDLVYSIEANHEGKVGHLSIAKIGEEWTIFGTTSVLKKGKGRTPAGMSTAIIVAEALRSVNMR